MIARKFSFAAALLAVCTGAGAQEAFKSLAVGAEIGTTGVGIEVATPIVPDLLVLKAGVNIFGLSVNPDPINLNGLGRDLNSQIDDVNGQLSTLEAYDIHDKINTRFSDNLALNASAKINMTALKALLEVYPFQNSSFHITGGAYIGVSGPSLLSADVYTDAKFWSDYKSLRSEVNALNQKYQGAPGFEPQEIEDLKVNVLDKTLQIKEKDGKGYMNGRLDIWTVRPYLGVGFGRSLPKNRFGVQFDLGCLYYGTKFGSDSEVPFDRNAETFLEGKEGLLKAAAFMPHISVRLVYRIF